MKQHAAHVCACGWRGSNVVEHGAFWSCPNCSAPALTAPCPVDEMVHSVERKLATLSGIVDAVKVLLVEADKEHHELVGDLRAILVAHGGAN